MKARLKRLVRGIVAPWRAVLLLAAAGGFVTFGVQQPDLFARIVEPLRTFVTIAAAAVGMFVALRGLQTWRRQLHGTARFDACRKLLEATLTARDAFATFRSRYTHGSEVAEAMKARGLKLEDLGSDRASVSEGLRYALLDRFRSVFDAVRGVESAVVVAEAVLGPRAREAFQKLRQCYIEAQIALDLEREAQGEQLRLIRRTISSIDEPNNEFTQRIEAAVEGIRQLTEPHIQARFAV